MLPTMILMAGCVPPQAIVEDRVVAPALAGIVEPGFIYRIQAPLTDVAYAASVSFIDPTGGPGGIPKTVATTVTTDGGAFNLSLPNFTPTPNAVYFMEAFKGLGSNLPGHNAARLRTLVQWKDDDNGGWVSLTSATPDAGIVIGLSTTALAVAAQLNTAGGQAVDYSSLIGKLTTGTSPNAYVPVANLLDVDYQGAFSVVDAALGGDLDPVASISKAGGVFSLKNLGSGSGGGIGLSPGLGADVGDTVTITGMTFSATPANNQVSFSGEPANVVSVSADRKSIQVVVPPRAVRGPVSVGVVGGAIAGVFDYPIFGMLDVTLTGIPGGSSQVDFTLTPFSGPASTRSILIPGATASVSIKSLLPGNGWTVMAEARNAANAVWAQTDRIDGPLDPLTLSNRPIAGPYEVKSGRQSWGVGLQVAPISGKAAN
jgi:hypothetical protein